ncbi:hypothetical protein Micbo1qcDRAFT_211205 [Microdochium bolleyi]|uniref:Uncharacterized protein n=1 Tax=Microdochium bolleyi TaxID=196109 RepID=A0A136JIG3_9PEZI|nr:hypothetical protein Micbo1qcDRAFT_211205 [Microdochium bolleyi]
MTTTTTTNALAAGPPAYSENNTQRVDLSSLNSSNNNNNAGLLDDVEGDALPPYPNTPPRSRSTSLSSASAGTRSSIIEEKAALAALYNDEKASSHYSNPAATDVSSSPGRFTPTSQLQIQYAGKPWLSLPLPPRAEPIPILAVDNNTGLVIDGPEGVSYVSVRPERRSGSCFLVSGDEWRRQQQQQQSSCSDGGRLADSKLASTTYRFGPGNSPVVSLSLGPLAGDQKEGTHAAGEVSFQVQSKGMATRAVEFETDCFLSPPPTTASSTSSPARDKFMWRYASSRERAALVPSSDNCNKNPSGKSAANSVLVLERVTGASKATSATEEKGDDVGVRERFSAWGTSNSSSIRRKEEEVSTRIIALLVRSDELRSPGSSASTAGNGGRLFLDLRSFAGDGDGGPHGVRARGGSEKTLAGAGGGHGGEELARRMVVATALVMLKREVDRRRAAQIAIMGGAGS